MIDLDSCEYRMESIRELTRALAYLESRPHAVMWKHELSWPISLCRTELRERRRRLADLCAPWFEPQEPEVIDMLQDLKVRMANML